MKLSSLVPLAACVALAGCGGPEDDAGPPAPRTASASANPVPAEQVKLEPDRNKLALGAQLYRENCAACHGDQGQGAPDWQKPGPDGKYPAPPLNGTGHAWHHPMKALRQTIRNGTLRIGGNMPAWKDKLTDQEIDAIIHWLQMKWPQELYAAWYEMDRRQESP